jgi:hypothetical protein
MEKTRHAGIFKRGGRYSSLGGGRECRFSSYLMARRRSHHATNTTTARKAKKITVQMSRPRSGETRNSPRPPQAQQAA